MSPFAKDSYLQTHALYSGGAWNVSLRSNHCIWVPQITDVTWRGFAGSSASMGDQRGKSCHGEDLTEAVSRGASFMPSHPLHRSPFLKDTSSGVTCKWVVCRTTEGRDSLCGTQCQFLVAVPRVLRTTRITWMICGGGFWFGNWCKASSMSL
jgi:hypothetical protein